MGGMSIQKLERFRFRLRSSSDGRITIVGVILSWKDGIIDIMDIDLKHRTIPENRIIKIERISSEPKKTKHSQLKYEQLSLL
jgi:hypothetical protein